MESIVHTVHDLRSLTKRAPGPNQVFIRTHDRGLQSFTVREVEENHGLTLILEPVDVPEELVELSTLRVGNHFRFQEQPELEFEVLDLDTEPSHELVMAVKCLTEGWQGRIGLSTGLADWQRGQAFNTLVFPRRRMVDLGLPPRGGPIPERRRGM